MATARDRRVKPRSRGKARRHHSVAILLAAVLGAASAQAPARQVEIAGTQRDAPDEPVDSRSKIHDGDQLKCLNALSKGFTKVARAQDRDIYDCIKGPESAPTGLSGGGSNSATRLSAIQSMGAARLVGICNKHRI